MLFGTAQNTNVPTLFGNGMRKPVLRGGPVLSGGTTRLNPRPILGSYKKGGKVKKTGLYMLHKGEKVQTKKSVLREKVRATMQGKQ